MARSIRAMRVLVLLACGTARIGDAVCQTASTALDPDALRSIVEALAHDTMAGRPTPSPALEAAAQYIAARFRGAGLAPLGDDGGYFQRYPVLETVLRQDSARIEIGPLATWRFGADFNYAGGGGGDPVGVLQGPVAIVSGRVTREAASALGVSGKVVIFLSPLDARGAPEDFRSAFALGAAGARAIVLPGRRPDSLWARLAVDADEHKPSASAAWPVWEGPRRPGSVRFIPILELWADRWPRLLGRAGIDSTALRATDGSPTLTLLNTEGALHFTRRIERVSWPANVVAVLPGSDPHLRHEYLVLTAHFDGLGRAKGAPPGPQSVLNGADDNASGTAVLIQLAQALGLQRRSKRSIIFAAVSGEENGLWGSDFFTTRTPVPRSTLVANLNLDMIGRAQGDTVYVTGRGNPALGPAVDRALRRGASRTLTLLGEDALDRRYPGEQLDARSDHANFRRRGIPSLAFFTGLHPDYHETTDDAEHMNYEALSRIAHLVTAIVVEFADAEASLVRPTAASARAVPPRVVISLRHSSGR